MKLKSVLLIVLICFVPIVVWAWGTMIITGRVSVSGGTTACVGYSNDTSDCQASLDASTQYALTGGTTTVGRYWQATTNGTVSKITYSLNSYTSSTEVSVAWYIDGNLQAYKVDPSPTVGENVVDMSSGATGTLNFSAGDNIYYCLAVNNFTGAIERDENVAKPPANYYYAVGAYKPDPISLLENTTRELALRLEYTY